MHVSCNEWSLPINKIQLSTSNTNNNISLCNQTLFLSYKIRLDIKEGREPSSHHSSTEPHTICKKDLFFGLSAA